MPVGMERRWLNAIGVMTRPPSGAEFAAESLGGGPALRVSTPAVEPGRTVLYVHGGGYTTAPMRTYRAFMGTIATETRTVVHAPDYPLAPEHPFPAAFDATLAAYRALAQSSPGPIVLAGDSAGGGLAVAIAVALRDAGEPAPAGLVLFCPWLDLTHSGQSFASGAPREPILHAGRSARNAELYAGSRDLRDPRISPLFEPDVAGLPPIYLLGAADDLLASDADRFADRVRDAGGEIDYRRYEGLWHDFQLFGDAMAQSRAATTAACAAISGFFASVAAGGPVEAAAQG